MKVCLIPIGNVDSDVLDFLKQNLAKIFGECVILPKVEIPQKAFNPIRGQYNSTVILRSLPDLCDVVLGVTEVDLYADELNFVFGEAELFGKRAVISLKRLRQEFYGLEPDADLLKLRALKEAVHEIGHVLGLMHCNGKCVMRFSNSIVEVDLKDWKFCNKCLKKLKSRFKISI